MDTPKQREPVFIEQYLLNRQQLKQLPPIAKLLPLTEKSVRKLELRNLDNLNDKRDFDIELEEKQLFKSIRNIIQRIEQIREDSSAGVDELKQAEIQNYLEEFKSQAATAFDDLNRAEDYLQNEIDKLVIDIKELVHYKQEDLLQTGTYISNPALSQTQSSKMNNTNKAHNTSKYDEEISEIDELDQQTTERQDNMNTEQQEFLNQDINYEDDDFEEDLEDESTEANNKNVAKGETDLDMNDIDIKTPEELNAMIAEIDKRIRQMGGAKGSWLESDQREFLRVYTAHKNNPSHPKFMKQAMDALAMNNIQILEHVEHYQKYLELEGKKKLITAHYKKMKQLKAIEQEKRKQEQEKEAKMLQLKKKKEMIAENELKKKMVQEYRQKKNEEIGRVQEDKTKERESSLAKEAARRQRSVAESKKRLEEHRNYKKEQERKLSELNSKVKELQKPNTQVPIIPTVPLPKKSLGKTTISNVTVTGTSKGGFVRPPSKGKRQS